MSHIVRIAATEDLQESKIWLASVPTFHVLHLEKRPIRLLSQIVSQ